MTDETRQKLLKEADLAALERRANDATSLINEREQLLEAAGTGASDNIEAIATYLDAEAALARARAHEAETRAHLIRAAAAQDAVDGLHDPALLRPDDPDDA